MVQMQGLGFGLDSDSVRSLDLDPDQFGLPIRIKEG
jgi:hypothetical protein